MPIRGAIPVAWNPSGCSDAVDGSNAFPGAMSLLQNLIRYPGTKSVWGPRPAAVQATAFPGFSTPATVSGMVTVGDVTYGMIGSARNSGKDEPFAYNNATDTYLTIAGITSGNTPTTQATTGDWTPPILYQVGTRIIVCHPGFPGTGVMFGWFDVSSFTLSTTGDTNTSTTITGNPTILGVQPGMTISDGGVNIPAGATVVSSKIFNLSTTGNTHGTTTVDNLASTTGVAVGTLIAGAGIPPGATVTVINSSSSVTISAPATSSLTGTPIQFAGATITLSAAATGSANGATLTIAGGTLTAPLWGAGDLQSQLGLSSGLPSVPLAVAQMNGRAWFVCGTDGILYSDSGAACTRTDPSQALKPNNGIPTTAIGPTPLASPLTGGIVQSLIAFQEAGAMQQITGDPTTNNLAMNALSIPTGTLAPLTIAPTQIGLAFMSPTGIRVVQPDGSVSDPIGTAGQGIVEPFVNVVYPSRSSGAANFDVLIVAVQTNSGAGQVTQEWWYDFTDKSWSGPHTFSAAIIVPWKGSTFVKSVASPPASLWHSVCRAATAAGPIGFVENGTQITCVYDTVLLPDNQQAVMNDTKQMTIAAALPSPTAVSVTAFDEENNVLDAVALTAQGAPLFRQWPINWDKPLVYKQMHVRIDMNAALGLLLGDLRFTYQPLGYLIDRSLGVVSGSPGTIPSPPSPPPPPPPPPLFYTLSIFESGTGSGTVTSGDGFINSPPLTTWVYPAGTTVVLTPHPTGTATFSGWTGDIPAGHSSDNPLTLTMNQNRVVTAGFAAAASLTPTVTSGGTWRNNFFLVGSNPGALTTGSVVGTLSAASKETLFLFIYYVAGAYPPVAVQSVSDDSPGGGLTWTRHDITGNNGAAPGSQGIELWYAPIPAGTPRPTVSVTVKGPASGATTAAILHLFAVSPVATPGAPFQGSPFKAYNGATNPWTPAYSPFSVLPNTFAFTAAMFDALDNGLTNFTAGNEWTAYTRTYSDSAGNFAIAASEATAFYSAPGYGHSTDWTFSQGNNLSCLVYLINIGS